MANKSYYIAVLSFAFSLFGFFPFLLSLIGTDSATFNNFLGIITGLANVSTFFGLCTGVYSIYKIRKDKLGGMVYALLGTLLAVLNYAIAIFVIWGIFSGFFFNEKQCSGIAEIGEKHSCYKELALIKKDIIFCSRISDEKLGNLIRDDCYLDFAKEYHDLNSCPKITSKTKKDICYKQIADGTKNPRICENILDTYNKDDCYKNVISNTGNGEACEKIISQEVKDDCLINAAQKSGKVEFCEKMSIFSSDEWNEYSTKEHCYKMVASTTKDAALCEKINTQEIKDKCLEWANSR